MKGIDPEMNSGRRVSHFCPPDAGQDPEQPWIIAPICLIPITLINNYTIAQFLVLKLLVLSISLVNVFQALLQL